MRGGGGWRRGYGPTYTGTNGEIREADKAMTYGLSRQPSTPPGCVSDLHRSLKVRRTSSGWRSTKSVLLQLGTFPEVFGVNASFFGHPPHMLLGAIRNTRGFSDSAVRSFEESVDILSVEIA